MQANDYQPNKNKKGIKTVLRIVKSSVYWLNV